MQATVHGKDNFEWTERLCGECSDRQYRRSCELCGQILATWDYRNHLTNNHSKEDIAKLQKNMVQVPTAAGIISGKNDEPATVVMNDVFADVKDLWTKL